MADIVMNKGGDTVTVARFNEETGIEAVRAGHMCTCSLGQRCTKTQTAAK